MLQQYQYLLEQIAENPEQRIDDYSLVTPSAQRLLPDPTATLDDSWHGAVHEIFARYAVTYPDKWAVEDIHGAWSYQHLNERSNRLAHYLLAQGLQREDIVAVYAQRNASLVWALLGILKAGAAFLVIDPVHPVQRIRDYLDIAAPKALIEITEGPQLNPEIAEVVERFPLQTHIILPRLTIAPASDFLLDYRNDNPDVKVAADDLAYIIFTSGSTGTPKAVMGRHGPLTHFLPWVKDCFGLSEDDHFSFLSSLSTNKLQREIFTALSLGGTLHMPDAGDIGNFGRLDAWMRTREITTVHLTPAMTQLLDETAREPIPTVRHVFFGGDLLQMRDVDAARRLMPNAEIVNFYNSSETQRGGGYKVFVREEASTYKDIPPLGCGVKDVQLLVINKNGQLAGVGEIGEIYVRSPHMARGFLGDEELTKARFITNPFTGIENDRVHRTGEQGRYLPNGEVEFVARSENRFSIRGFRVELGEIETALGSHPAVAQAVVVGCESPSEHLVAYYSLKKGLSTTISEIRDFLGKRLPKYMVPAKIIFLESVPLTPTGKVDRRALPAADYHSRPELETSFVAPRTAVEEELAKIWTEVLTLDQIGIHDSFFDLGGHSLLATQVISRVLNTLQVELPLRSFFEVPTVAGLAKLIETIRWITQGARDTIEIKDEREQGAL
jgi:amino acid adenylation domain-containing protein